MTGHKKLGIFVQCVSALAVCAATMAIWPAPASAIIEKPFREPLIQKQPDSRQVKVDASTITYDPKTEIATATGKVVLIYGPYKLTATHVTFNRKTNRLTANGSVVLKEPRGNVAEATQMSIDLAFRDGFAKHVRALLTNDASITAVYATRKDGRLTIFENATYTACKDCQTRSGRPLWELVTDKTVHDQQKRTLAHTNPKLQIAGQTVFAFPYLELPDPSVRRRTGFLFPSVRGTEYTGFGLVTPFFWAPAPNYDVTLRPWFTLQQGPVADVEWRHRLKSGRYNIRAYGLNQLDPQSGEGDDEEWRGAVKSAGKFALNQDWDWGWNAILSSDRAFLRRYNFDTRNIGTNELFLTGLWDQTYISAKALHFNSLSTSVDPDKLPDALPYVDVEHILPNQILGGNLEFSLNGYSIQRDETSSPFDTVNHGTNQTRLVSKVAWKREDTLAAGQLLTTFASLRNDLYLTENVPDATAPGGERGKETVHRILPSAGVDLRWPFIASNDWGSHVITPVAQIIASPGNANDDQNEIGNEDAITLNFDHSSLFLEDRHTGLDRYESGVRTNIGLTYNYLRDDGSFVRASIGESFHLAGENSFFSRSGLDGPSSDIVAALTVSPWQGVSLSYEGRFEEDLSAINRQEASLGLSFDRFSGQAGYLFIDKEPAYGRIVTEEYALANARVGLGGGWNLTGNMSYDLQTYFFRNRAIGLEFDCDCMNAKLSYAQLKSNENADVEHRVLFSFDFATLGGTSFASRF